MATPIVFNDTAYAAGYFARVVGTTSGTYRVADVFSYEVKINGTVNRSGDAVRATGNGGRFNETLVASVFDNSDSIVFFTDGGDFIASRSALSLNQNITYTERALGDYVVCFATGTRILTERGAVAVEDLAVGDLAVTADGAHRPIRWIGHRTMDPRRHPEPNAVRPVRIAANALGEGKPARDLRVSPGHAIAIDVLGHVLVPAWALINGMTVTQEDVASVTYWHVELDGHDLLVAEGQPAESYLDMGNRGFFADSPVLDLAAGPDADAGARTHADFCRPYHDSGPLVDAVRARLHARALALGWHTARPDAFADVRVEADGHPVHGDVRGMSARFVLPAGARDVWLSCPTAVPAAVLPDNGDGRALGLCLARITLDDGLAAPRAVALDDPLLCLGFHRIEADHRWTGGLVRLPAALFEGLSGAVFLRLDLHAPALPRWVGPAAQAAEAAAPRLAAVA